MAGAFGYGRPLLAERASRRPVGVALSDGSIFVEGASRHVLQPQRRVAASGKADNNAVPDSPNW
jgi:hypothetical protein